MTVGCYRVRQIGLYGGPRLHHRVTLGADRDDRLAPGFYKDTLKRTMISMIRAYMAAIRGPLGERLQKHSLKNSKSGCDK